MWRLGRRHQQPGLQPVVHRAAEVGKDATSQGPAPDIEGATAGGTITVFLPGDPGPDSLDPTDGWSVTGNSIQQALTNRSLTQYSRDAKTGQMVLVPDLATDLGTPNDDFTEWTFTIRDDAKWEDGKPVTPEEIAWGIQRSMDSETFPAGPGTEYSQTYFWQAGEYKGPYTDKGKKWDGVTVDGQDITIKMSKPFPDMDYWGAFMAMGPAPLGNASEPPDYGQNILSDRPLQGRVVPCPTRSSCWSRTTSGTRPPTRRGTSTPTSGSSSSTRTRPRSTRSC